MGNYGSQHKRQRIAHRKVLSGGGENTLINRIYE